MLKRLGFLAALIASPAWAGLMVGSPSGGTIPNDVTLPVSSTPVGAVAANAYSGWTNPADTAANDNQWTSPSTSIRYLYATNSKYPIATTVGQWRDVEVTTWVRTGCVLVRWSSTTAVYFEHQGETTNGLAAIGVITGINPGGTQTTQCPAGLRTELTSNSNLVGTVPGYSKTDTAGDTFTFGCVAWTCYIKFNGVEFLSVGPDIRLPMAAGMVALSAPNTNYGFRDTSVDWLPLETIYSIPSASIYDMRDFGFTSVETTGSITSGSSDLTVASSAGYAVGDDIIVECGTEAGACARNTVGVGGTWPAAHYANDAAMDAAVPCTADSYAYLEDTGKVRRCRNDGVLWHPWDANLYYLNYKAPRALSATITAINGNVLTLNTAASATATNANVYRDSTDALSMFDDGVGNNSLTPKGTYRFAARTVLQGEDALYLRSGTSYDTGVTIEGAGLNKADPEFTFFAPDGSPGITLTMGYQADYVTVDGVYIRNNIGRNSYGMTWTANGTTGRTYPVGIILALAQYSRTIDSGALDSFAATITSYCYRCELIGSYARITEPQQYYVGWQIQQADSLEGSITDGEVDSDWMIAGFEVFRSDGTDIIRPVGRNAALASNSSGGGWLIDEPNFTIEQNSQYSTASWSEYNPVININSNIQPPNPSMEEGGTIRNPTIINNYLNVANDLMIAITVNLDNPNITIEGTYPSCASPKGLIQTPGWASGTNSFWGGGVRTSGDNTIISGIRFDGDADYGASKGNIHTEGGSGKDVTATNNVMDHSATGTSTITETGTITNAAYEGLCP